MLLKKGEVGAYQPTAEHNSATLLKQNIWHCAKYRLTPPAKSAKIISLIQMQRWGESHIHSVAESRRLVQDGAADIASLAPEQLC